MPNRTLRTIGASAVLVALVVVAALQVGARRDWPAAEIEAADPTTTSTTQAVADLNPTTTVPDPFVYRLGVLSGISTDNFWAFYGDQPSVWNSYVLGPTKPALYTTSESVGELEPELAETYVEPRQDGDQWAVEVDFHSESRWSDGEAITAGDLAFTFETVRALGLQGSWEQAFPASIESIHAEGDHVVRIEFSERPDLSVWPNAVGLAPVMAEHIWSDLVEGISAVDLYGLPGTGDVAGGPLTIVSVADDLLVSRSNPGYRNPVGPETVEYHVFPDEATAVEALNGGEIDSILTPNGLAAEHLAAIESNQDVAVVESPANAVRYVGFNLNREPMSEQAFRTAVSLLLDRERLAVAIPHAGSPAFSMITAENTRWVDGKALSAQTALYERPLGERLALAIEGLASAGYAWESSPSIDGDGNLVAGSGLTIDGRTPPILTILTPGDAYDPARAQYAEAIASTLAVLGFDARPVVTDFDTVVDLAFTPDEAGTLHYDMYVLGWTLGNPARPDFYEALFSVGGPMNNTGYASDAFASALAAYHGASDERTARRALWDMEEVLATDLPYLPLYNSVVTEAYRSDRVQFEVSGSLGGLQARLGGIRDVNPAD